jgi:hypothetical protein
MRWCRRVVFLVSIRTRRDAFTCVCPVPLPCTFTVGQDKSVAKRQDDCFWRFSSREPPKSLAYLPETAPTRMTLSEKRRDPLGTAITLKPREATARRPERFAATHASRLPLVNTRFRSGERGTGVQYQNSIAPSALAAVIGPPRRLVFVVRSSRASI